MLLAWEMTFFSWDLLLDNLFSGDFFDDLFLRDLDELFLHKGRRECGAPKLKKMCVFGLKNDFLSVKENKKVTNHLLIKYRRYSILRIWNCENVRHLGFREYWQSLFSPNWEVSFQYCILQAPPCSNASLFFFCSGGFWHRLPDPPCAHHLDTLSSCLTNLKSN